MGNKLTKTHFVVISLNVLAFVLVLLILAKIAGKRVLHARFMRKLRFTSDKDIFIPTKREKTSSFLVLPEFPYGELQEKYVQPSVFHDAAQVIEAEDDVQSDNLSHDYGGILYIKVQFDLSRSMLSVLLSKATDLPSKDTNEVNYYMIITLFPQKHKPFQSRVHKTLHPEFNETFEFAIPMQYLLFQSLKFSLWTFDRFSHHEIMADGLLHLSGLEKYGLSISREISVAKRLGLVEKASGVCGEIFLSLGYLRLAERLAVVIIKVINLPKVNDQAPDPFVDVTLLRAERKLKLKRTSTKQNATNPMYNETLTFDVPAEQLHETSLLFCVLSRKSSNCPQVLGKVLLGPEASGENFDHWDELLRTGTKPRERWHKLWREC